MWLYCAQVTSNGQIEVTKEHWPESRKKGGEKMILEWFVAWERWAVQLDLISLLKYNLFGQIKKLRLCRVFFIYLYSFLGHRMVWPIQVHAYDSVCVCVCCEDDLF